MTKPKFKKFTTYPIDRSPFYGLSNKRKLAEILKVDKGLLNLASSKLANSYKRYKDGKTNRAIEEPFGDLLIVQRRILKLLSRIEQPSFLHSAVKLRSYKTNAEAHLTSANVFKIDIQKFYRSVKYMSVYRFFEDKLCCAPDIATILSKLCTVENADGSSHLPTGGCLSPVLSFFANQRMFSNISELCEKSNCTFTVYVDDITISGENATHQLMMLVSREIARAGYKFHKYNSYRLIPATVTGLVLTSGKLRLPHKRAKLIRTVEAALEVAVDVRLKAQLLASLIGRLSEAEHIDPAYKAKRHCVLVKYFAEWKMVTEDRVAKSQLRAKRTVAFRRKMWNPDDLVIKPSL